MNKYFLRAAACCAFFISLSVFTSAQINRRDIVYLKNGSIIKGNIVEMIPDSTLKIETSDGSIFIYKISEVEKTAKEEVKKPEIKPEPVLSKEYKSEDGEGITTPKGYFIMGRLGPNLRILEGEVIDVSLSLINGYHINKYLSLGLGVEATRYSFGDDQNSTIPVYPVFVDVRLYVPKRMVNPMFSFQFGYSFTGDASVSSNQYNNYYDFIPESKSGGLYMAVGAGLRVVINKTFAFLAEGGLSFQSLDGYDYSDYSYSNSNPYDYSLTHSSTKETIPSLRLNIGFSVSLGK